MKAHKPSTVKQVLCLLEQNKSIRQVAKETRIPKSTVHELSRRLPILGESAKEGDQESWLTEMRCFCEY